MKSPGSITSKSFSQLLHYKKQKTFSQPSHYKDRKHLANLQKTFSQPSHYKDKNIQPTFTLQRSENIQPTSKLQKAKDKQLPGTDTIRTKAQPSEPKWKIMKMTISQNTKRTYSKPNEQLSPKRWPLSYLNLLKYPD